MMEEYIITKSANLTVKFVVTVDTDTLSWEYICHCLMLPVSNLVVTVHISYGKYNILRDSFNCL